jgi:hypothetical protein
MLKQLLKTLPSLQYEFLRQLSSNASNIVVGLVRDKSKTEKKVAEDGLTNVTILEADILDLPALQVRGHALPFGDGGLKFRKAL